MTARRTLIHVLLLASGALPAASRAAEPPAVAAASITPAQQAQAHFQRGIERYDDAEYALSLVEFQRAYALRPSYQLLFTIGQVHYQLRQYARARAALEEYLAQGRGNVENERRAQVEQQLDQLRARTGELRITVNVAGAEVSINDEVIGASPIVAARFVDVGAQRISASKLGFSSAHSTVVVAGGEVATVGLTLRELSADAAPGPSNLPATLAWVSAGVLAAGAVGTGVATVFASHRYTEMRNEPLSGSPAAGRARLDDQQASVSTLATSTDILAGAALAAAGLALYFTLRTPPAQRGSAAIEAWGGARGLCIEF